MDKQQVDWEAAYNQHKNNYWNSGLWLYFTNNENAKS